MYQKATKLPNDHKIDQTAVVPFPFQGPSKLTQIGIFGLKIYHLATLLEISIVLEIVTRSWKTISGGKLSYLLGCTTQVKAET
jgi:hypothetical protein